MSTIHLSVRYFIILVFCFSFVIIYYVYVNRTPVYNEVALELATKTSDVTPLRNILNRSTGTVCILYPYQSMVSNEMPQSARINAYLKVSNYLPDEGYWSLVYVDDERVIVSTYKRSEKLDILATHEIQPEYKKKFPVGFEPANCLPIVRANFMKIESRNRIFLIFGEIK